MRMKLKHYDDMNYIPFEVLDSALKEAHHARSLLNKAEVDSYFSEASSRFHLGYILTAITESLITVWRNAKTSGKAIKRISKEYKPLREAKSYAVKLYKDLSVIRNAYNRKFGQPQDIFAIQEVNKQQALQESIGTIIKRLTA